MSLSKVIPFILITVFSSACSGAEVLNIENEEANEMVTFPARNFEASPEYTIMGITFLPVVIRDQVNDRMYFSIRSFSKDPSIEYEVKDLIVKLDGNDFNGKTLFKANEEEHWVSSFDDWYTNFERLKEFNYTELFELSINRVEMELTIVVIKNGENFQKDIIYELNAEKRQYSGF